MENYVVLIISIIISIAFFGITIYFIKKQFEKFAELQTQNKSDEVYGKWLESIQGTMDVRLRDVQTQLDKTTTSLNKNLSERLDHTSAVINSVQKELGTLSEIGRNMRDLQDFLKSPKLRGNIGEEVLKDLLEQMIPKENYQIQYQFKTGAVVDAVIFVEEGLIPIDSKFPFENFNTMVKAETEADKENYRKLFTRDVKKHILDISEKYILINEGTVDFALMYIPSESIYYEIVVNTQDIGKYSWANKVIPVSPNLFYSYLKAILIGLEGKKIESRVKEIMRSIKGLKDDSRRFEDSLRLMAKHLNNAKNTSDDVISNYDRFSNRINNIDKLNEIDNQVEDEKLLA